MRTAVITPLLGDSPRDVGIRQDDFIAMPHAGQSQQGVRARREGKYLLA